MKAPVIEHQDSFVKEDYFRFRLYGNVSEAAVLVLPGLHPDGVDDARLDRFCRVLSDSGCCVGLPELPTMSRSIMDVSLLEDAELACAHFADILDKEGVSRFGLFCISASSIAGIHLAVHPLWSKKIYRLHLFGGFIDWVEALRFSMTGTIQTNDIKENRSVDPLGLPVVYMNVFSNFPEFVSTTPELREAMLSGWYEYVSATWEREHVQHPQDSAPIALSCLANMQKYSTVSPDLEELFLQGCSVRTGGQQKINNYLDEISLNLPRSITWLNPKPLLEQLQVPLDISHGKEDFVVPYTQANEFPLCTNAPVRTFVTGLYHHTGTVTLTKMASLLWNLPKEILTSIRLVQSLVDLMNPEETEL